MAAQITAVIIFLVMFAFIITEKIPRHIATTLCSVATLILVFGVCMHSSTALFETLNFQSFTSVDFWRAGAEATESTKGINWQTIIFIFGVMIMVEGMAISGFFSWLCLTIAKAVRYNKNFCDVYGSGIRTVYVYRQYHRYSVSGRNHHHTRQTVEI